MNGQPVVPYIVVPDLLSNHFDYFALPDLVRYRVLHSYPGGLLAQSTGAYRTLSVFPDNGTGELLSRKFEAVKPFPLTSWCAFHDEWVELCWVYQRLQVALNCLVDELCPLRYADVLERQGGIDVAPNPLCEAMIFCPDPDAHREGKPGFLELPDLYRIEGVTGHNQWGIKTKFEIRPMKNHFVCPDLETWARLFFLYREVQEAQAAVLECRSRTYAEALQRSGRNAGGKI